MYVRKYRNNDSILYDTTTGIQYCYSNSSRNVAIRHVITDRKLLYLLRLYIRSLIHEYVIYI